MSGVDRVIELLADPEVIKRLGEAVELYNRLRNGEIKVLEVKTK